MYVLTIFLDFINALIYLNLDDANDTRYVSGCISSKESQRSMHKMSVDFEVKYRRVCIIGCELSD